MHRLSLHRLSLHRLSLHPVTELVTGLDLVHLQILVAEGHPLPLVQSDITLRGHAIECRIYAEDPDNNFFPSPGRITRLLQPSGPGIREDAAIFEGFEVPLDYDPMLSKLVAYAPTREDAIDRMLRALDDYVIGGIQTNLSLFRRILLDQGFRTAAIDTGYLERLLANPPQTLSSFAEDGGPASSTPVPSEIAAIAAALFASVAKVSLPAAPDQESLWAAAARREALRA